ncbi:sigma-54-dependent transcriptional regulator [Parabacteroides sp. FAFU027]|uniref:sigma-54-dependent transcriptional regulator n=1 Tax=Parabacteroides sp. FAFU027 TaxID=2922715 RepID=UPI001FAED578|nr:sigma-54 dependent transcriptional regulator [Parabacteroides sp. FAFU027]
MNPGKILVVDDNKSALSALNMLLQFEFKTVVTLSSPNQIVAEMQKTDFDIVLLDMNFKSGINTGNEGIYWLDNIKKAYPDVEVIMITAYGEVELAVKAIKHGATDFILKPWENEKLLATLHSAMRLRSSGKEIATLKQREQSLKNELNPEPCELLCSSPVMQQVLRTIDKVARTDANVLITGENGTGKEVIAREIHLRSNRSKELMVTVDMGAVHEHLFESELFGHKKGAFTDARDDRTGKFVLANRGTLFLDEIANLPLPSQSKLLVALQNRAIVPLGANQPVPIDIRLITATNANLDALVEKQLFRQDLLYRINTIRIEVPPLRERGDDIELLAGFFLKRFAKKYQKPNLRLNPQIIRKLMKYPWPGNVRELQHTIEKAVILCEGENLSPDDFNLRCPVGTSSAPLTLEALERQLIEAAMDRHNGNLSAAASELGISRQTLYNKISRYGH